MKRLILIGLLLSVATLCPAQDLTGTYLFARRDTCDLFLDVYDPAPDVEAQKPTILFAFGGGFITGKRNDSYFMPWIKHLSSNGYRVISIDYRLGLKGVSMKFGMFHIFDAARKTKKAVDVGVEDVFSAVRFICDNAESLGVDPSCIVLPGSSAGAMISLSAEWEICKASSKTKELPEGFNFAGVMSFAGAIITDSGKPSYRREPCPHLLIHGTNDGAVTYGKKAFGRYGMYGSSAVAKILEKEGRVYNIYRYEGHSHDMAANLVPTWPQQKKFLDEYVLGGSKKVIDLLVNDPEMPVLEEITLKDIY